MEKRKKILNKILKDFERSDQNKRKNE